MPHVLIVDDDANLLDALAIAFEDHQYDVSCASDGDRALAQLRTKCPDLIISDVNMSGVDGFTLLRVVREQNNDIPIILLTSRDTEIDEALGLELGADDYVTKPFSTRILLARVKALLRRQQARQSSAKEGKVLVIGELELDSERLEVRFQNQPIQVTLSEFRLLEALASRPGIVFTRDQLMDKMRGDDSIVADRIIDTYVRRLRRKLETIDSSFAGIETVIGAGYRWRQR